MSRYSFSQHAATKGFTLIELVVVIAILGILAGIAIPRFLDAQASAKGAKIVADLRTIDSAATVYYAQKGQYPTAITGNDPATTDGFVGKYLAAWPVPDTGTFIVAQLKGGSKTYEGITDDFYTLTTAGRGEYHGHPVEWYLGGGDTYYTDSTLIAAINATNAYLTGKGKIYISGDELIRNLNGNVGNLAVDASILSDAGLTGNYYWHTNQGGGYFWADSQSTGHGEWRAKIIEVNGNLYSVTNTSSYIAVSGMAGDVTGQASYVQAQMDSMVAAGTAKKLGTIATK